MNWIIQGLLFGVMTVVTLYEAQAGNDSFIYDSEEVNSTLAPLTKLEHLHHTFPNKTIQELLSDHDLTTYSFKESLHSPGGHTDPMPVLPAFYWGCFLSVIGIFIVYKVAQDPTQTNNAFLGCFVNIVSIGIIFVLLSGIFGTNFHLDLSNWTW